VRAGRAVLMLATRNKDEVEFVWDVLYGSCTDQAGCFLPSQASPFTCTYILRSICRSRD